MDYINAATSGTLSPHVLPVVDVQKMLSHIADALPSTLHLPVSPRMQPWWYNSPLPSFESAEKQTVNFAA